jgi:hypothetical protein
MPSIIRTDPQMFPLNLISNPTSSNSCSTHSFYMGKPLRSLSLIKFGIPILKTPPHLDLPSIIPNNVTACILLLVSLCEGLDFSVMYQFKIHFLEWCETPPKSVPSPDGIGGGTHLIKNPRLSWSGCHSLAMGPSQDYREQGRERVSYGGGCLSRGR